MLTYLSRILYVVTGKKIELLIMAFVFFAVSLLDTVGIGLIGPFMGLATSPNIVVQNNFLNSFYTQLGFTSPYQFIAFIGFLIVLIFCLKSFLNFQMQAYVFRFSFNQWGKLVERLIQAYLAAEYTFHLQRNTSAILQTILVETGHFANAVLIPILISTSNVAVLSFLLILLAWTSPVCTAAVLGTILITYFISNSFKGKMSLWNQESNIAQKQIIQVVNHSMGGIKESKVIGCESYFEDQISGLAKTYATSMSSLLVFGNLPRILIEVFLITFLISFTSLFLISGQNPQRLIPVLSIFAVASIRMLPAASGLLGAVTTVRSYRYVVDKLYFDLKEVEDKRYGVNLGASKFGIDGSKKGSQESQQAMVFSDQVVLQEVSYSYPNSASLATQNISLMVKKGEAIALIGKSGAGKTTLVDIILGLLCPQSGDIKVDGISIYDDLRQWQNLIGYIPQSIFLMDDTIEHNIAFGVPDEQINSQRLQKAIAAAQISQLMAELPEGIKTQVGERGVRLSGGQRQRIGIARALYHEREILVLDEATAALDNETEQLVNDAIKSLSGQKTLIIIAHRLSTVEHCDRIYLMKQGRIDKEGSYAEVVLGESPVT